MGPQGNAEYVSINANFVFPYPETVDPVHAGGMPIVFLTAYHLLKSRGQVQPGDTVLIQAGASGVGTVAIQLAKAFGARVITTASSTEKLDLTRSLGADETINYVAQDFEEEIRQMTNGNGVELILECVGGPVLEKSVRCVASYGKLISYGNASGAQASLAGSDIFAANRTVIGFSMGRSPARAAGPLGRYGRTVPHAGGWKVAAGGGPRAPHVGSRPGPPAPVQSGHPR